MALLLFWYGLILYLCRTYPRGKNVTCIQSCSHDGFGVWVLPLFRPPSPSGPYCKGPLENHGNLNMESSVCCLSKKEHYSSICLLTEPCLLDGLLLRDWKRGKVKNQSHHNIEMSPFSVLISRAKYRLNLLNTSADTWVLVNTRPATSNYFPYFYNLPIVFLINQLSSLLNIRKHWKMATTGYLGFGVMILCVFGTAGKTIFLNLFCHCKHSTVAPWPQLWL